MLSKLIILIVYFFIINSDISEVIRERIRTFLKDESCNFLFVGNYNQKQPLEIFIKSAVLKIFARPATLLKRDSTTYGWCYMS